MRRVLGQVNKAPSPRLPAVRMNDTSTPQPVIGTQSQWKFKVPKCMENELLTRCMPQLSLILHVILLLGTTIRNLLFGNVDDTTLGQFYLVYLECTIMGTMMAIALLILGVFCWCTFSIVRNASCSCECVKYCSEQCLVCLKGSLVECCDQCACLERGYEEVN